MSIMMSVKSLLGVCACAAFVAGGCGSTQTRANLEASACGCVECVCEDCACDGCCADGMKSGECGKDCCAEGGQCAVAADGSKGCCDAGCCAGGCCSDDKKASVAPGEAGAGTVLTSFGDAPLGSDAAVLYVNGLGCPMCATNVDLALNDVEGVQAGRVNLEFGTVQVAFPGGARPSAAKLASVVADAGFSLQKIELR